MEIGYLLKKYTITFIIILLVKFYVLPGDSLSVSSITRTPPRRRSSVFCVGVGAFTSSLFVLSLLQHPTNFLDLSSNWPCLAIGTSSLYFMASKRLTLYPDHRLLFEPKIPLLTCPRLPSLSSSYQRKGGRTFWGALSYSPNHYLSYLSRGVY